MIYDEKAEKLEQAGLYRRAAARWLTVLDRCRDAPSREWIARRRLCCIEQAETPRPVTDTFGDVHRAATELQKSMGFWQPEMLSEKSKSIHHGNSPADRALPDRMKNECEIIRNTLALTRLHSSDF